MLKQWSLNTYKAKTELQEEIIIVVIRLGDYNTLLSEANRLNWQKYH